MRITVSGAVGSGKSTVSKLLADELGYAYHSVGDLLRKLAKKHGTDIVGISKKAETDPSIDKELDDMQRALAGEDNFVMDSRLGFHFIPNSYKVYLKVGPEEAAKRIMKDTRSSERYKSAGEAARLLRKRMDSESKRYKEYYGITYPDEKAFDVVIDTTNSMPENVVKEIKRRLKDGGSC
ncbi:cytidylate kinase family protein [Candidatus Woesearchaeota archaeon]|nr:cytidylate kinase family protein [Candidatus Woesearchaeota archaeon]